MILIKMVKKYYKGGSEYFLVTAFEELTPRFVWVSRRLTRFQLIDCLSLVLLKPPLILLLLFAVNDREKKSRLNQLKLFDCCRQRHAEDENDAYSLRPHDDIVKLTRLYLRYMRVHVHQDPLLFI